MATRGALQQNRIVAGLPEGERYRVARLMEPVDLLARTELVRAGEEAGAVYFPTAGLVSVVSSMADGSAVECGAVGPEGWIGAAMFGGTMPAGLTAMQQIAGSALRITAAAFETALAEAPAFAAAVARFRALLLSYAMQTAACNRLHDARARCARWLLFVAERLERHDLALTNEFLAQMVGGSRSAVAAVMSGLERDGFVERSRAHVVIRDARGIRGAACECYGVLQEAYARYLRAL